MRERSSIRPADQMGWGRFLGRVLRNIKLRTAGLYLGAVILLVVADPTRPSFTAGLLLVALGESIRLWAAGYLQKNRVLVTGGPYGYVKNPLYIGTMLITAGFSVMANNIYFLTLAFLGFILYYIPYKRRVEHQRLRNRFGDMFIEYDRYVDDYMPRLRAYEKGEGVWRFRQLIENGEPGVVVLLTLGVVVIGLRLWF
jgi:protein-S-isoprenylcysteine O-methyltransferase Ste14